jgi:hypothetical protein
MVAKARQLQGTLQQKACNLEHRPSDEAVRLAQSQSCDMSLIEK